MSHYEPLTQKLSEWFDKPLTELPDDIQELVGTEFSPLPWDKLTSGGRRSIAEQLDCQRDPANEPERLRLEEFFDKLHALQKREADWQAKDDRLPSEALLKEQQLAEIEIALKKMQSQLEILRGDYLPNEIPAAVPPVDALTIKDNFMVKNTADENHKWWTTQMRDANRNGLSECRIGAGKKGPGGSLWRPDLVACWLVDKHKSRKAGMAMRAAKTALSNIDGCSDIAEELFPEE